MVSDARIYTFSAKRLGGETEFLSQYKGQVLLIVNTASKCGFTSQYAGLQALYEQYKDQGFSILGFPCNQFGAQEPGSDEEIQSFCQLNYGVTFPMFEKIDVNGAGTHPLFDYLKNEAPGLIGTKSIKWNFTKFLVGADGKVVKRYAPTVSPDSLRSAVEDALVMSKEPSVEEG